MDWDAIYEEAADLWRPDHVRPPKPGVYRVEVRMLDPCNGIELGRVTRFARWTGAWWTCWATTAYRAQGCTWRGPLAGYRWQPV
jgi:hypothetical protein